MMQGGLHPDLDICWFEEVFSGIKARYPIHIHSLSPPEIVHIAKQSDLSVEETLTRLHAAGLDSLPGGGAEVLVDRVRTAISPHKIPTDTWLDVMRVAHGLGMKTTATMMFGSLDTPAERIEHLRRIRDLQDETGGFTAFIPWTFQAGNTELQAGHVPATGVDYLVMLAGHAPLPRQRAQHPGLVGHPRLAHGAGRARLRRQRHGLDDDRGERRRRRRRAKSVRRRRDGAAHPRRRPHARAARHAVPRGAPLLSVRCSAAASAASPLRSTRNRRNVSPNCDAVTREPRQATFTMTALRERPSGPVPDAPSAWRGGAVPSALIQGGISGKLGIRSRPAARWRTDAGQARARRHRGVTRASRANALGLLSSVVIGVASTAPAYSLAATLGFIVAVGGIGLKSPAIMIVSFIPMLLIAGSYYYLNRVDPDCGTTFTWVTRAFGPRTGWVTGWIMVAADIIVMASLAQIAGSYFFLLFGADGLAASTFWTTARGHRRSSSA